MKNYALACLLPCAIVLGLFLTSCSVSSSPPGVADFGVSPTSLTFGSQTQSQSLTITNTGNATLNISAISVSGSNASDFAFSPAAPLSVAPGGNAVVKVTFQPTDVGQRTASLTFTDNASGSPQTVALSGTGVVNMVVPSSLAFGTQAVGSGTTQTILVSNTGNANAPLNISNITVGGTNSADFTLGTTGLKVPPQTSGQIDVTFTPGASGARSASLTLTDNASGSPQTVALSGAGVAQGPAQAADASVTFEPNKLSATAFPTTITVTIQGTDTTFFAGATEANFGPGAAVSPDSNSTGVPGEFGLVNVINSSTATAQVTFDSTATTGPRFAIVMTNGHQSCATFVVSGNSGPVANAGMSQVVPVGKTAYLDGSGSSAQVAVSNTPDPLTYEWTLLSVPNGSTTTIADPTSVRPSFVADKAGNYLIQLAVTDTNSNTRSNWVMVSTALAPPAANAGTDQFVTVGQTVQLDGSGSTDPSGNMITYNWQFTQVPTGSAATLSNPSAVAPTFVVDLAGDYVAELTVNDGNGNTPSADVLISTTQTPPVANAGPNQDVSVGNPATLDGSASYDPDGETVTCSWSLIATPPQSQAQVSNAATACSTKPTFTPDQPGIYVAQLTVADTAGNSSIATVALITGDPGPVAVAGAHQTVDTGTTVQLDGSSSSDAAGNPITGYTWALLSVPNGSKAALSSVNVAKPTFVADLVGDYVCQLIVFDGTLTSVPNTVRITAASPGISVAPTSVSFPTQTINTTSASSSLVVTNTGNGPLIISTISISGPNQGDFASTSAALPVTVLAGQTTTINVTFTPTAGGARSATLNIGNNVVGQNPLPVPLSGTGGVPVSHFSPNPVAFGSQLVGTTSAPQTLTISNSGSANLIISNVTISGDYAFTPSSVQPVAPGGSAQLTVTFTPTTTGSRPGTLTFVDNASATPETVTLSGTGTAPGISASPNPLAFGNQLVGTASGAQATTITNTGTANLAITALSVTGTNAADFGFPANFTLPTPGSPITVAPQGNTSLPLVYTPHAMGPSVATLNITYTGSTTPFAVGLSGTGVAPVVSISPNPVVFASQPINTSSSPLPVTISNATGTAALSITAISFGGANASDFTMQTAPTLPLTVPAGGSTTLNLIFTPKTSAAESATLTLTDNALNSPQTVTLTGNGVTPVIAFNPTSLAFGNQTVNIASSPKQVTISNTGTSTLTISAITKSGANAGDFTFSPTAPISVAPGNNTVLNVTFTPSSASNESASLVLTDNTVEGTDSIPLSGTGVVPGISFNPTTGLSFGTQLLKTPSSPLTVTVTNTGQGTLLITSLTFTGTNASDFSFPSGFTPPTQANPITVQPNANAALSVIFTPQNEAAESAALNLADNAAGSPQTVALSGTGVAPHFALTPSPTLAFGNQQEGTTSAPATITITNSGGADLSVTALAVSGTNAADFAFSPAPTLPLTVSKNGGTATLSMVFKPSTGAAESATVTFTDNAASSPQTLGLTGTGTAPQMGALSPLSFPGTNVGSTSSALTETVTNTGTAPMQITGLSFGGSNPGDFGFASGFSPPSQSSPIIVSANGGTTGIPVVFTPTAAGARSASLLITDNAAGSPQSAALSGTGNPVPIFSPSPTSLTFSSTTVGFTSAPIALTITNTGQANLVISSLITIGTNAGDYSYGILPNGGAFPQTVAPSGTLVLNVFFKPSVTGPSSATLVFTDNTSAGSHSVPVSGTGIAPVAQASLSPNPLTFTQQLVQTTSAPMAVTITNNGTADLNVTAASISGTNASDFAVTTTLPITVPKSGGTGTINITFTPAASGARTAALTVTDNASPPTQQVTLNGTGTANGTFTLNSTSIGGNMELLAIGSVSSAPSSNLTVTITSSDATKVLLEPVANDPSGTSAGTVSFTGTIAKGTTLTPGFWIQALPSLGSAQITVSATGYNPGVATVTVTPSGFVLNGPGGAGVNFTTTLGQNTSLAVSLVQLDNSNNVCTSSNPACGSASQVLRGGQTASINVNSGTTATGTIAGNPAVLQAGANASSTVTFQPVAAGTSVLSINQPSGYATPNTGTQLTATVTQPTITLNPVSVGFSLQALGGGQLGVAPSSTLTVTISSNSSNVLLSTSPTVVGTSSIILQVSAGATTLPPFYIQGTAASGTGTLTASATGYSNGTGSVVLTPSAFLLSGPNGVGANFTTTTISPPTALTVTVYQLNSTLQPVGAGQLWAGISNLSVAVVSGTTSTGTIVGSPATFSGDSSSNSSLTFQPNQNCSGSCTSALSVTQPSGFSTPATGGQLTVTVSQPAVTLAMSETTLGGNLEWLGSGALTAPAPSNLQLTITSSDPTKVLLSNCGQALGCTSPATTAGSQSITVTVPQGGGVNSFPNFYAQGVAISGTAQLTASAPGFASGSITVTLAPSGLVISGANGVGQNVSASVNSSINLAVTAVVLDPNTLAPTSLVQPVSGALSPSLSVTVTSNNSDAVVTNSPVPVPAGTSSGTVTVQTGSTSGVTAIIGVPTPSGFTTPSTGNALGVVIQ